MSSVDNVSGASVYYIVKKVEHSCSVAACSEAYYVYEKHSGYQDGFSTKQEANNLCVDNYFLVSYVQYNENIAATRRWRKTHAQKHARHALASSQHLASRPNKRIRVSCSAASSTPSSSSSFFESTTSSATPAFGTCILPGQAPPSSTFPAVLAAELAVEWDEAFDDEPAKMDKYKNNPADLYRDYGYCLIRGDDTFKQLANGFNTNIVACEKKLAKANRDIFDTTSNIISGGVRQIDITKVQRAPILVQNILDEIDERVRHHLKIILPSADYARFVSSNYRINAAKWLQAKPGFGDQALHLDSAQFERFSVLIYLGDTMSTLLPRYPLVYSMASNNHYEDSRSVRLWCRDHYYSVPVSCGDILLFRHDIIHAGVKNMLAINRNVLFLLYDVTSKPSADEFQQYEWTWLYHAINRGQTSEELFSSLIRNSKYRPLSHIMNDEDRQKIYQELSNLISSKLH